MSAIEKYSAYLRMAVVNQDPVSGAAYLIAVAS